MEYREFTGKTVEEAVTAATVSLGLTSDQIEYEVVEKGSNGFLGFASKDAVIKVISKAEKAKAEEEEAAKVASTAAVWSEDKKEENTEKAEDSSDVEEVAKKFLDDVFHAMNLEVEIDLTISEEDNGKTLNVDLKGPEMGIIIGKRGMTLDSLQYLTNLAVNRTSSEYVRVKIDTEDYRRRRKETLENLAHNVSHKVQRTGKSCSLEAMNPYERRVIHAALADDDRVVTHSEGEEPYRHVVVSPKR